MLRDASHRSQAVDACELAWAAMLLSMRASTDMLANESTQRRGAKHQPVAVGNDRRLRFIVSGLLFTMDGATPTCRAVSVCSAAHRWAVSDGARIEVMAGGTRGGRGREV
jgi:hypothetical protein